MFMRSYTLSLILFSLLLACSKTPSACEECVDEPTNIPCVEDHRQFQQGVFVDLQSGEVELFDLFGIDQFYEVFLIEADLNKLSEDLILISSEHGNYIFDRTDRSITSISDANDPVFAVVNASHLYFQNVEQGSVIINDSTSVENVQTQARIIRNPISLENSETVITLKSEFSTPDTLDIPSIYFPIQIPGQSGFIGLYEIEKNYVSVSSTTNRVRKVREYSERAWARFDDGGVLLEFLTTPIKVESNDKPERFAVSGNPLIVAYQTGSSVWFSNLTTGSTQLIEDARSPQLSEDGKYLSTTNFNEIEVHAIESGNRFMISDQSDYVYYNPSTFLESREAAIFMQKENINGSRNDAVVKRALLTENGVNAVGDVFNLTEHIESDNLDFLITRGSQPVVLENDVIFFLLFQHHVELCD